jgi:hypothetical protein
MCFVLYVGTAPPLPLRPWREEAPEAREGISLSTILDPHFHFKERLLYGSSGLTCRLPRPDLRVKLIFTFERSMRHRAIFHNLTIIFLLT